MTAFTRANPKRASVRDRDHSLFADLSPIFYPSVGVLPFRSSLIAAGDLAAARWGALGSFIRRGAGR